MSDFDSNPFADPEAASPFQDPSVRQAAQPAAQPPAAAGLDGYNPFADQETAASKQNGPPPQQWQPPPTQPAIIPPTEQPPAYSPSPAQPAPAINTEDLQRRQDELERKAAELQRKEQELRSMQYNERKNNFPPLPAKCCVQPCFYQDFEVDIPLEFQRIVKIMYYVWIAYVVVLIVNVLGCLTNFIVSTGSNLNNEGAATFAVSLIYLVAFTPCSFLCWYRPIYKAFKSDSSFNFFVFFFIFFMQCVITGFQALGVDGWGTCGWINTLSMFSHNVAAAIVMLVVALMFSGLIGIDILMLIRIHRIYRSTGASFAKAQDEFRQGVITNRNVQSAAGTMASAAARSAVEQQMGGGNAGGGGGNRF